MKTSWVVRCRRCGAGPDKGCKPRLRDRFFGFSAGPLHRERVEDYTNLLKQMGFIP